MNHQSFLTLVPKPMKVAAIAVFIATVMAGIIIALGNSQPQELPLHLLLFSAGGLVGGLFLSTWLLSIGYVFADARRRAMRPVLWTLVVILFPHLLGFLLYFVMRQPLAAGCSRCGLSVVQGQRFCSWCGAQQTSPANFPSSPGQPQGANG